MFRALLFPSSGAHDYSAGYHIGLPVLGLLLVGSYRMQPGHLSSLTAPNFKPRATQEPDGQCGNQRYSRELLMISIVVLETY